MQTKQKHSMKFGKPLALALMLAAGGTQAAVPATTFSSAGTDTLIAYAGQVGAYAFDTKPIDRLVSGRPELVFPQRGTGYAGGKQQAAPSAGASSLADPKWLLGVAILGFAFFSTGRRNRRPL